MPPRALGRGALALLLAGVDAKKTGKENSGVTIWFTLQGAKLAACPFCVDFYEIRIRKAEYLDGLERKGGDNVAAQVGKADVIWMQVSTTRTSAGGSRSGRS